MKHHKRFIQGKYNPVNKVKYIGPRSPEYRSSWELKFFMWCDKNVDVLQWSSEAVVVPYISPVDEQIHRYFIDGFICLRSGDATKKYLVEIKPYKQTIPPIAGKKKPSTIIYEKMTYAINQAKWNAAEQFAKSRNLHFVILTENELCIK